MHVQVYEKVAAFSFGSESNASIIKSCLLDTSPQVLESLISIAELATSTVTEAVPELLPSDTLTVNTYSDPEIKMLAGITKFKSFSLFFLIASKSNSGPES